MGTACCIPVFSRMPSSSRASVAAIVDDDVGDDEEDYVRGSVPTVLLL